MRSIFLKEIHTFFRSLIGYIVIGGFLLITGLLLFVFPDTSLLEYPYASLAQFFELAPGIFLFLIPAITMRSFAEEWQAGTFELLATKPLTDLDIILGKFFAAVFLVAFALIPTFLYVYTLYQLGSPPGSIDMGAIRGSYLGLLLLGSAFVAIGLSASALTTNQIVAFLLGTFLCFMVQWGFFYISKLPVFVGIWDDLVQKLGIDYHYRSISRGIIDTRDLLYFISVVVFFLALTRTVQERRKW